MALTRARDVLTRLRDALRALARRTLEAVTPPPPTVHWYADEVLADNRGTYTAPARWQGKRATAMQRALVSGAEVQVREMGDGTWKMAVHHAVGGCADVQGLAPRGRYVLRVRLTALGGALVGQWSLSSQPLQVPQPPNHLHGGDNDAFRWGQDAETATLHVAVPQCVRNATPRVSVAYGKKLAVALHDTVLLAGELAHAVDAYSAWEWAGESHAVLVVTLFKAEPTTVAATYWTRVFAPKTESPVEVPVDTAAVRLAAGEARPASNLGAAAEAMRERARKGTAPLRVSVTGMDHPLSCMLRRR